MSVSIQMLDYAGLQGTDRIERDSNSREKSKSPLQTHKNPKNVKEKTKAISPERTHRRTPSIFDFGERANPS
jgi:hypothetical protein